ncbi:MAG: hypothetical protein EOM77_02005 [Bacteroidia bacterium]|nr:hypothetical protein [Bacteroidia bacterium]
MDNSKKRGSSKAVVIRNRTTICVFLYLSAAFSLIFLGLSFLDSYAVAGDTIEEAYYSGIQLAIGIPGLDINYLLLSGLILGTIGGLLTLATAIIFTCVKKYSPIGAMLIAIAVACLTYGFVVSLLFPIAVANAFEGLANPVALISIMWPIYAMSGLLGAAMLIDFAFLIYASIDAYSASGITTR